MSTSVTSEPLPTDDKPTQLEPLRAVVEAYVLNDLDLTTHPSYTPIQQEAWALSGRLVPALSIESPKPFVSSGTLCDVAHDKTDDAELSL